jgi:hypothetical protein
MVGRCTRGLAAAILAAGVAVAVAGAAQASQVNAGPFAPNYTFPDGSAGFELVGQGAGPINPILLVGFNPQPDPPGVPPTTVDLSNPTAPRLFNPSLTQDFALEFDLQGLGDGTIPTPPAPNSDGITRIEQVLGNNIIDITLQVGPGPQDGSWQGFNPQPIPPGDVMGVDMTFPAGLDPFASFSVTINGDAVSFSMAPGGVPEPESWALMILGFAGAGGLLRARRRIAALA